MSESYLSTDASNPLGNFLQTSNSHNDKRKSLVYDNFESLNHKIKQ